MLQTKKLCKKVRGSESSQGMKRKQFKRQKVCEHQSAATALSVLDT